MQFPVYRKYANGKSHFRIDSETSALEIQFLGRRCLKHTIEARILPERQLIKDLMNCTFSGILVSDAMEFEAVLAGCEQTESERE